MRTQASLAHERLLQTLPVRTHRRAEAAEPREDFHGHRTAGARDHRRQAIRRWLTEGTTKEVMAARLQVTVRAVEYHLEAITGEHGKVGNGEAAIRQLPGGQKVKRCAGCKVNHELAAFTKGTGPGGLHRYCRAYQKLWRQRHRGQAHG